MQLIQLTVLRGDTIVREIEFKRGLNLILDKPTTTAIKSGNNLGKTTVLRLIDFCLGSDGDDIWQDSEFKKSINQDVYDFLHSNIAVSVLLKIQNSVGSRYVLQRSFVVHKKGAPAFLVNESVYRNISDYRAAVKALLFGSNGTKPTLRQLTPKFIRSSQATMSKTLKFLGDYGSEVDYEALLLFLFGFFAVDVLEERPRLTTQKKKLERDLQALTRARKEGEIDQLLIHLRGEIEEMSLFNQIRGEVPEIAAHANAVTSIRADAANAAGRLGRLEGEIASIQLTIDELQSEYSNIDRHAIESIYREAQKYIPKLHHDWNDLSNFVQSLRGRKMRFLEAQAELVREEADLTTKELASLQTREGVEISTLMQSRAFNEALEIRADLQEKLKRLGSLEQDLVDIHSVKTSIANVDERLQETKHEIDQGKALLQERVGVFNKYFAKLSKALYSEQYLLTFDETPKGSLAFQLTAIGSNVGTGKKLSQTAAFDVAYIEFLNESGINFPRFVCHDGLESIHGNQLSILLSEANKLDGQLILATLRDKLPPMPDGFIAANTILELSQEDKLFRF